MTRRDFITLLGAAVVVLPWNSVAQSPAKTYRLGTLTGNVPLSVNSPDGTALLNALAQRGYSLGKNLAYDARGAGGEPGRPESLETTSLHLDVLRDLKRIHSHICSVAYPVLDAAGEMPIADVAESDPITLSATGTKPAMR